MRFPRKGAKIDQEKTNELVAVAIDSGINFFDTAYIYPGSEEALGEALIACGGRDKISIATKLPHYLCKKKDDFDKIFNTQLKRLKTNRIDYYFIHMLGNVESWNKIKALGIEEWISTKKQSGEIGKIGFSFHGGRAAFVEVLDEYDWEFCMVQYNYLDEFNQAGVSGVREAHKKGIPVFAMEPLRGGLLADNLPKKAKHVFEKQNQNRTPAWWALQWLWNQPEVTMALSGMSSLYQLNENCAALEDNHEGMFNEKDLSVYETVKKIVSEAIKVPCTACEYCIPCPKGVDIPSCFSFYNESYTFGRFYGVTKYIQNIGFLTSEHNDASLCISCGVCEKKCPQEIPISKTLQKVERRMATWVVKPIISLAKKVMRV
jgi:predicted aldo/keto reductase-like oxidoreductase